MGLTIADTGAEEIAGGPGGNLRVEEVTDLNGFNQLEPVWNELLGQTGRPTVFLTFEWLATWWACHAGPRRRLCILVVREGSRILGIAPLMSVRKKVFGLPVRTIELLSMAEHADHPAACSGTLDFIVRERTEDVLDAMFTHLTRVRGEWQFLRFHPVPRASALIAFLDGRAERLGWRVRKRIVLANATARFDKGWDDYFRALPGRFRKQLRRKEALLRSLGSVEFRGSQTLGSGKDLFDEILDIERRSWKWRKGVSVNSAAYKGFYRAFADSANRKGWLRLWKLIVNGEEIAYDLCVEYGGEVQGLKKSYDARFRRFSPGTILEWKMFEEFVRNGAKAINVLWGNVEHKRQWAPQWDQQYEVILGADEWYARFLSVLLYSLSLDRVHRVTLELTKRVMRKTGIHWAQSELTRSDQLRSPR